MCVLAGLLFVYVLVQQADAEVITEGFDQNSAEPIVISGGDAGEKIVRFLSSRFAWGGFCPPQQRGIFTIVDPTGAPCLVLNSGAAVPGSYVYTRFDTATESPGGVNGVARRIDLSPATARVVLTMFWSLRDAGVAVMLRDEDGWWRSSAIDIPAISWPNRLDTRYVLDPKSLSWKQLRGTADMDEVDDGGAGPLAEGASGTPDWASIKAWV